MFIVIITYDIGFAVNIKNLIKPEIMLKLSNISCRNNSIRGKSFFLGIRRSASKLSNNPRVNPSKPSSLRAGINNYTTLPTVNLITVRLIGGQILKLPILLSLGRLCPSQT